MFQLKIEDVGDWVPALLNTIGFLHCTTNIRAGAFDVETGELIVPHDARRNRHRVLFGHVSLGDFCFERALNFAACLNRVTHRASGPTRIPAECEELI